MQPLSYRPMTNVSTLRSLQSLQHSKHCLRHIVVLSFLILGVLNRHTLSVISSLIRRDFMKRRRLVLNNLTTYVTFTRIPHYPNTTIEVHRKFDRYSNYYKIAILEVFRLLYFIRKKNFRILTRLYQAASESRIPFFKHLWHFSVFFLKAQQKIFF